MVSRFFFFNDTATTEIYTLSLHDALPILCGKSQASVKSPYPPETRGERSEGSRASADMGLPVDTIRARLTPRSEEHTSELQSRQYLVCRLLLEKKKNILAIKLLLERALYI